MRRLFGGLGSFPSYFLRLREVNRRGPKVYGPAPSPLEPFSVERFRRVLDEGAQLVDARPIEAFAGGHIPGALAIELRPAVRHLAGLARRCRPAARLRARPACRTAPSWSARRSRWATSAWPASWPAACRPGRPPASRAALRGGPRRAGAWARPRRAPERPSSRPAICPAPEPRGARAAACASGGHRARTAHRDVRARPPLDDRRQRAGRRGPPRSPVAIGGPVDWAEANGRRLVTGPDRERDDSREQSSRPMSPDRDMPARRGMIDRLRFGTYLAPNMLPVYEAIADAVGRRLGIETELVVETDYDSCARGQERRLLRLQPALRRFRAPGDLAGAPRRRPVLQGERYGGRPIYFSDVIVHRDSPFRSFLDLRGCSWAYNEPLSHSGYGITRYHLVRPRRDPGFFGEVIEAGFHEESIRMVAARDVDASAIDSQVLAVATPRRPVAGRLLRVIDALGPSTIQPVAVSKRLPPELRERIRRRWSRCTRMPACRRPLLSAWWSASCPWGPKLRRHPHDAAGLRGRRVHAVGVTLVAPPCPAACPDSARQRL